jgi:RNA polymerase sigma-70 factor, ECF subfamily
VATPSPRLKVVAPDAPAPEPPPSQTPGPLLSLDELFRAYASYVGAIALRLLGRVEEVDDVVQDVFLRAHAGLKTLREAAAVKGWLATVTVRVAQRRLRTRRVRAFFSLDSDYDYMLLAQPGFSPEDTAMLAELYAILDELPAAERLAWTLRHIEGERLERVAELVGASLATVKRRIAAAAGKLKERADG